MREAVETRFAVVDGVSVAYQVVGDGFRTVVFTPGSFNNVDVWWDDATTARFLRRSAAYARLVLFDRRGTGASDPLVGSVVPTWHQWVDDLNAVLDEIDVDTFSLVALLDGVHMAMLYAGMFPNRVESLVLYNASARMRATDGYNVGLPDTEVDARLDWVQEAWGTEALSARNYPGRVDDQAFLRWYARYQRASVAKGMVRQYLSAWYDSDARHLAPLVTTPTLLLHRSEYHFVPVEQGRWLASQLPNSTFVELSGGGSVIGDRVDENADHIERFITGTAERALLDREYVAVLFTDIVDSTRRLAEVGDRAWRSILDAHDELATRAIRRNGGNLIKTTGDGVLATFATADAAVETARSMKHQLANMSLETRAAVHVGDVELRDDGDIGGLNVHVAARLLSHAPTGTVALSAQAATSLNVPTSFAGHAALKGVPGQWAVYTTAEVPQRRSRPPSSGG